MSDFDFTFYAYCTEKYKKNQEGPIKKCAFKLNYIREIRANMCFNYLDVLMYYPFKKIFGTYLTHMSYLIHWCQSLTNRISI